MPETIPPTAPFSVATQAIDGDEYQRMLLGTFYEFDINASAAGSSYAAGDALGDGGERATIPVGVYTIRGLVAAVSGADVTVPGLVVGLIPSAESEPYTPAADGDTWTPAPDARSGHLVLIDIPETAQLVLGGATILAPCPDRERRIVIAPRLADNTLAADATAKLFGQMFTTDGVTFGGAIAGVSMRMLVEYMAPLPTEL